MEESSTYRGKHLIRKIFLLRVIENSSYGRKFDLYRKNLIGKIFLLRVIENSVAEIPVMDET
jgi:hypothetical protein